MTDTIFAINLLDADGVKRPFNFIKDDNGNFVSQSQSRVNGAIVTDAAPLPSKVISSALPAGASQDGTDATGVSQLTGGVGIRGWLSGIYSKLAGTLTASISGAVAVTGTFWQATQPVSAASLPLPTGASQDGTDGTGITPPAGAVGIRGWLSAIFQKLNAIGTYAASSVTIATTPTAVLSAASGTRYRVKAINTDYVTGSGGSGIVIWGRWGTVGAAPAAVRGSGSFPILPGSGFDDIGGGVNQGALNCIAESGSPILYIETY